MRNIAGMRLEKRRHRKSFEEEYLIFYKHIAIASGKYKYPSSFRKSQKFANFRSLCYNKTMDEQQQILFMQIRLIRMATKEFSISLKEAALLFEKYGVLPFIRECWGVFHVEGDNAVFDDVREYLKSKGAAV